MDKAKKLCGVVQKGWATPSSKREKFNKIRL
jgi:hypothetical protein